MPRFQPEFTEPALVSEPALFDGIGRLAKGESVVLPLLGKENARGRIHYVNHYSNGATAAGGTL